MKRLLYQSSSPVAAEVASVRLLIDSGWMLQQFLGAVEPTLSTEQLSHYLDVDTSPGMVGLQGHWWYRGEINASAPDGTAQINYRVYNIAKRAAWAVPLANRMFLGYEARVKQATTDLARAIQSHLEENKE